MAYNASFYSKLNTKEDKYNAHKILGIYCSLHNLYRCIKFICYDTMGFNYDILNALSVLPHFILPITSLIFYVFTKRALVGKTMIWEEMRFHSIAFTVRSIGVFYYYYFFPHFSHIIVNVIIVFACHLGADYITKKYGDPNRTTIRIDPERTDSFVITMFKRFYSFSQVAALLAVIIPGINNIDSSFSILLGIHYAAFFLTLQRKNIINVAGYTVLYSLSLLMSEYVIYIQLGLKFYLFVILVFLVRINTRINKYIIWLSFSILFYSKILNL